MILVNSLAPWHYRSFGVIWRRFIGDPPTSHPPRLRRRFQEGVRSCLGFWSTEVFAPLQPTAFLQGKKLDPHTPLPRGIRKGPVIRMKTASPAVRPHGALDAFCSAISTHGPNAFSTATEVRCHLCAHQNSTQGFFPRGLITSTDFRWKKCLIFLAVSI